MRAAILFFKRFFVESLIFKVIIVTLISHVLRTVSFTPSAE